MGLAPASMLDIPLIAQGRQCKEKESPLASPLHEACVDITCAVCYINLICMGTLMYIGVCVWSSNTSYRAIFVEDALCMMNTVIHICLEWSGWLADISLPPITGSEIRWYVWTCHFCCSLGCWRLVVIYFYICILHSVPTGTSWDLVMNYDGRLSKFLKLKYVHGCI
jgi:hypothetical protein